MFRNFSCLHKRVALHFNRQKGTVPQELFRVGNHVKTALLNQDPVVALESTIITHGMPYPHNLR